MIVKEEEIVDLDSKEESSKPKEKNVHRILRLFGRIVSSIFYLVLIYWILLGVRWILNNFEFEWIGYLIIFFVVKTKIFSFIFAEGVNLSDNTMAVGRVLNPDSYNNWRLPWIDIQKIKLFIYDPFLMLRTDWKHSIPPNGLTNVNIRTNDYFKKIWFSTLLQITFGYLLAMGYLNDYSKEIILVWGVSCFVGTLFNPIRYRRGRQIYWTIPFFYVSFADILYMLSAGYTRRGRKTPFRLLFSMIIASLSICYYLDIQIINFRNVESVGEKLWQYLLYINPENWF